VVSSVKDLLRKTDKPNSIYRKVGSGRKQTVQTTQNVECVAELICSQEGNPGSSKISEKDSEGQVLSYEVFAVLLRHICKHVFPFVFHHCDIIQLGCFDSIVLFVNNILTSICAEQTSNLYGVSFCP